MEHFVVVADGCVEEIAAAFIQRAGMNRANAVIPECEEAYHGCR